MLCSVYCSAHSYDFELLSQQLYNKASVVSYREALYIKFLEKNSGEIFVFPYGVFACWNSCEQEETAFLELVNQSSDQLNTKVEFERYEFIYEFYRKIGRDKFSLPNKDVLTKLAVSFGLAQSIKLTLFEEMVFKTINDSKWLTKDLASRGKIFLSRKAISKKIGLLFLNKASVNLHSDILDEPDFFWDFPEQQPIYQDVFNCFDIQPRMDVLNHRLTIMGDLLEILNDQLNHQYSSTLEWMIIGLITIEVVFVFLKDLFHLI